jgi:hypothetical protein
MAKTVFCKDGFLNLDDLKDIVDVNRVVYYTVKHRKDSTLVLKLYDKKKKLVKPYRNKR